MRRKKVLTITCIAVLVGLIYFSAALFAQEEVERQDIKSCIEKGIEYLKSKQAGDGSWDYLDEPFKLGIHLREGCTWFTLFALLKSGVSPKEQCIQKGLESARKAGLCHVYCVSCMILALEAYYISDEPEPKKKEKEKDEEKGMITRLAEEKKEDPVEKFQKKVTPEDRKLLEDAVKWLISKQEANIWRYPGGDDPTNKVNIEDCSNTQYAMLALSAARRMKIPVPVEVFQKVAEYMVNNQEKDGPEVPWFPVPAADHSFKELKKVEKEIQKEIHKLAKEYEKDVKKAEREGKEPPPADGIRTAVVEKVRVPEKIFGGEKKKIRARGWCYMWNDTTGAPWRKRITGSMTTSGAAALTICKEALEEANASPQFIDKVSTAIRDGCGWLASKFSASGNPTGDGGPCLHLHYYLYGLERVGILALVPKYGEHDWYKEGVEQFLHTQRVDGSWDAGSAGTSGPVPDTCWALLFICRATTPLVQIPEEIYTGEGLLGPKRK